METKILVRDAMIRGVVTAKPTETIVEIAKRMIDNEIGCLIIAESEAIGIITERDIVKIVSRGSNPTQIKAREVMSAPIISTKPTADLYSVAKLMSKFNIRRLPVVEGKELVGIITSQDIVRFAPEEGEILSEILKINSTESQLSPTEYLSGECERCNNFSEYLVNVDGVLLCEECREVEES